MIMGVAQERDLDALLAEQPAGARIELDGGLYVTAGRDQSNRDDHRGITVRPGWTIEGNGSTIRLDPRRGRGQPRPDALYGIFVSRYGENAKEVRIQDITFDMGYAADSLHACSAVGLFGDNMSVERCRVMHWGNGSRIAESFLISLGAPYRQGSSLAPQNVIRMSWSGIAAPLPDEATPTSMRTGTNT